MENFSCSCPSCGAPVTWDADKKIMHCQYCDHEFIPEEAETHYSTKNTESAEHGNTADLKRKSDDETEYDELVIYHCRNCGGELVTSKVTAASMCVYCGSAIIPAEQVTGKYTPDFVLPFMNTRENALATFKKHICKPFTPKKFIDNVKIDKMQGVYIPFRLFSGSCRVQGQYITQESLRKSGEQYTKTYNIQCLRDYSYPFNRLPVNSSSKTRDDLMESLEPFDYGKMKAFTPGYLSGFLAERYDTNEKAVAVTAGNRIINSIRKKLIRTCAPNAFTRQTVVEKHFDSKLDFDKSEYVLLPVWLLHCSYRSDKYIFAMNGQTGKFTGNPPVGKIKVRAFIITLSIIVTFLAALYRRFSLISR